MLVSKTMNFWQTSDGRQIPIEELDRQHLSNIFWYHLICHNKKQDWALEELSKRYNGQPVDYRPHSDYVQEIKQLEKQGNLVWRNHIKGEQIQVGEIYFEDKRVGFIWRYVD